MTEEEITRFALVLKECERLRAMMAEEAALSTGGSEGMPMAAAPAEELPLVTPMANVA